MKDLNSLFESVVNTAHAAYKQKETQDVLNMAAATLNMAQAYGHMKAAELDERAFNKTAGFTMPGEQPPSEQTN